MRLSVLCLLVIGSAFLPACDQNGGISIGGPKPTPTPVPTPFVATPTPKKAGDWMFDKNRGNPLEQKPKK